MPCSSPRAAGPLRAARGPPVCASLTSSSRRAGRVARILSSWACVSLPGRDRCVQVGLGRGRERRLQAVHGLAVGGRDGCERLAGRQLRAQIRGRDADVGRRGIEARRGRRRARRARDRRSPLPPGPPPSAKSGASALARRASIAVAWALVSVPAVTCASIWSTIAFLIAAVSAAVLTPSWPAASAAIDWVCAAGDVPDFDAATAAPPPPSAASPTTPIAARRRNRPAGVLMTFILGPLSVVDRCLHLTSGV